MSIWPFNKPKVDIVVRRNKAGSWFHEAVDSESGRVLAVSAAKHLRDDKRKAVAEAQQMGRVRQVIVID